MGLLIIIVIIFAVVSLILIFKDNEKVRTTNIDGGGLHTSFDHLVVYLEKSWGMKLDTDTGRSFSFSKTYVTESDKRRIIIGVKLDLQIQPVLFSKLISDTHGKLEGLDILGVDFQNYDSIEKCVKKSMNQISSYMIPEQGQANSRKPTVESIKNQLERELEEVVVNSYKNNPLKGTPLEGVEIYKAVASATGEAKETMIKYKIQLGLTEDQANAIVDEVSSKVIAKYLKF